MLTLVGLRRSAPALVMMLAAGLLMASTGPSVSHASAQESTTTTVGPRAESWYRSTAGVSLGGSPLCDLDTPLGCGPGIPPEAQSPPHPYPEGTLHVGAAGGIEEARTYVTLDFSTVDYDARIVAGTLSLPIDMAPESGSVTPDLANLQACLATGFVVDGVSGDITGAPTADCGVSTAAVYVEAVGDEPARFDVDLDPFIEHWGPLAGPLALVPGEGSGPADSWHVAFSRRDREGQENLAITALLTVTAAGSPTPPPPPPPAPVDNDDSEAVTLQPAPGGTLTLAPAPPRAADPLPAPEVAPPSGGAEQPEPAPVAAPLSPAGRAGYAYPGVFLLPLILAAGAAWVARAFTADLAQRGP